MSGPGVLRCRAMNMSNGFQCRGPAKYERIATLSPWGPGERDIAQVIPVCGTHAQTARCYRYVPSRRSGLTALLDMPAELFAPIRAYR